mmetsp:Transcript_69184/g.154339  ORF Transcript_69184/g.154339 Transcript_69184/m.154339 type:complete len:248 (+) Transcript_69184:540-1283(+)
MWLLRATPTPRSDRPHWRAPALLAHWGRAAGALAQMGRHIAGWGGKYRDEALAPAFRVALGVRHRLHSLLVGVLRRPLCIVSVSDTVGCDIPCRPLIRTGRGRGAWRLERGEGWLRKLVERWVRSSRNRWIKRLMSWNSGERTAYRLQRWPRCADGQSGCRCRRASSCTTHISLRDPATRGTVASTGSVRHRGHAPRAPRALRVRATMHTPSSVEVELGCRTVSLVPQPRVGQLAGITHHSLPFRNG